MSGNMKKLICALLTGTMLLSSVGLVGFAADDTAAPTAQTTAASEATAAPVESAETTATEAPAAETTPQTTPAATPETQTAPESTKYDNDAYYKKALALCQGLGIITGYEDGSIKPDSTVTRAEMAAIILRMLANSSTATYQNIFTDVDASHWAAGTIQTASGLGIINGMGDGTFVPDGNVQYEQVAKMIVCAMNYDDSAKYSGGYPNGYMKVASDLDITKSAAGTIGVATDRGVVIKMIYNALLADYNEPAGMDYGQQQYKAERTLAEYAFDVKEEKGTLLGTAITSLTSRDLQDGQVLIQSTTEKDEDPIVYNTALEGLDNLLAANVTLYYQDNDNGDTRELLAIAENPAKTESVTIKNGDISEIEEFEGFDGTQGKIKLYGTKKYDLADNITVVFNGSVINEEDFDKAQAKEASAAAKAKEELETNGTPISTYFRYFDENGDPYSYTEFLQPGYGSIRLVENNDEKKGYDFAFIDSYETLLVSSATAKKIVGKMNNKSASIDVDADAKDLKITTMIDGDEAKPRNLKKDSVVSVKRSLDDETIELVKVSDTITGAAKNISTEDGKTYTNVNGTKYEVDPNAGSVKTGTQSIFYLDMFGRIGYIESESADGMLQSGEKYGWLMSAYDSDNGEETIVNILGQDGKAVAYELSKNVDWWAPRATEAVKMDRDDLAAILKDMKNMDFVNLGNAKTAFDNNGELKVTPLRMVKYKANSSNELSRLYCAVDASTVDEKSGALRVNPANMKGVNAVSGSVAGYTIADGILEFSVPMKPSDMKTASNYSVGEAKAENYVIRENGSNRDYVIGEFDGIGATLIIKFTASANEAASYTEMGTADSGPSIMVVDSINTGRDDDDNQIYEIVGYSSGSEVSVTTNKNTNVAKATKELYTRANNQTYFNFSEALWNAPEPNGTELTDFIHKGDIILYTTDGRLILQYASAEDAKFDEDGNFDPKSIRTIDGNGYYGTARVSYYFGSVEETNLDDIASVKISNKTENITFDPSKSIDLVTINKNGKITVSKEVLSVSDLEIGDYLLVNLSDKNTNLKAMIAYRIED